MLAIIYSRFREKSHKRNFLGGKKKRAALYSGSQTQWDRLSKQSTVRAIRKSGMVSEKAQVGLILGWYFTRGDLEYK